MSLVATLNSGVSALDTFAKGIQTISDNIGNVNTTGFKTARAEYVDTFANTLRQASPSAASGLGSNSTSVAIGAGVQLGAISKDYSQGTLSSTGKNTDLGISGNGFFRVRDSLNALDYVTRAGNFRLDDQGYLVTSQGFRVQGLTGGTASFSAQDNGGLQFVKTETPPTTLGDIKVDYAIDIGSGITNDTGGTISDAEVSANKPSLKSFTVDSFGNVVGGLSNGDSVILGKVLLQQFRDPNALTREGNNLYSGFAAAGPMGGVSISDANNSPGANGLGRIQVGTLELSNVDLSKEFSDMIVVQRSFQAGSRVVTTADSMLEEVINLKR